MLAALLPVLGPILGSVAKSVFPDPAEKQKADELQAKLQMEIMAKAAAIEEAAAGIVKAEAASNHWLAANWRPITALTFVGIIVAHWFGYTAPGITEAERLALWDIVHIMIGGYVASRGIEKVAPSVAAILKR